MADRRNPERHIISILLRCQDQVARFTMLPASYNVYDEIMRGFLGTQVIPYWDFRGRMIRLLQNPRHEHLRIFYDVLRRRIVGEEQEDDGPLFFYPVVIVVLFYSFLSSVQLGDALWDIIQVLDIEWAREWSRLRNRRYYPGYYVAGEYPINDSDWNSNPHLVDPKLYLGHFVYWCQEQVARMTMLPEDYRSYERITSDLCLERTSHDAFKDEMGALLRDPHYEDLRIWWNVFHTEMNGGMVMEDNPSFTYPLLLYVRLNISHYRSLFGDSLWSS